MTGPNKPTLDLRTRPSAAALADLPGAGKLPLKAGVVRPVSAMERTALETLGWKDGDPIPGDLAEVYAQLAEESTREAAGLLPVAPDTPPVVFNPVPIESLPAAQQARLRQGFQEVLDAQKKLAAAPTVTGAGPGVNEALAVAEEPAPPAPNRINVNPTPAAPVVPSEGSPAGLVPPKTHCPRCRFDLSRDDPVEASREDKLNFLQAVLGGDRFRKAVDVFGGQVRLVFRALTTVEGNLAFKQLGYDYDAGRVDERGYLAQLFQYRLAMGLEAVESSVSGRREIPPVAEVAFDAPKPGEPPATVLPSLLEHLKTAVLSTESLYHITGQAFSRFQALVEKLEANFDDPDFWKGIGGPR